MIAWRLSKTCRLIDAIRERVDRVRSVRSLKRVIESNGCRINGDIERFSSRMVQAGDLIEFYDREPLYRSFNSSIIFEDKDLVVINKAAGISTDAVANQGSLLPVHRIDKGTTGLLLFAKTSPILLKLSQLFKQREVEKKYLAVVDGIPNAPEGEIRSFLARQSRFQGQTIWKSSKKGLYAETKWVLQRSFSDYALLCCSPKTGRTHQIRVHLSEIGHPILIDRQYASRFRARLYASRPLLHAWQLQFEWNGQPYSFEAPLPHDIHEAISHC